MTSALSSSRLCWLLAGATLLATAAPSLAQSDPEEIIITGRYGKAPDSVQSLSQVVGYGDLDLSIKADRDELRRRLNLTARFLCEKLGESSTSDGVAPSCRDAAVRDAMARVGTIEENFGPRGTTWVHPPRWQAPYPDTWSYP